MSFARYPAYKDSGVAWLGVVPEHWKVVPMLACAAERTERNSALQETNLLSLSYGRIVAKDIDSNDGLLPASFETYQVVYPEDVVLRLTDLQNDQRSLRSALVRKKGIITSAYTAISPKNVNSAFLSYLLRAYDTTKVFYSMGGGLRQSIGFDDLKRLPTLLPTCEEQAAIAAFLDRETAKIDALVAEQRRLIDLLREKRQAVISHAVTKGLNPDVPLKDSGVEWLGEVPAHWQILKGGRLGVLFGSEQVPEDEVTEEGDLPFIKVGSLSQDSFEVASWNWFVAQSAHKRFVPRTEFIVFPKRGAAIFTNKVNIVRLPSLLDPNLMGWQINERARLDFVAFVLKARGLSELADVSTVPQINNKHIAPQLFPVPPIPEQDAIVAALTKACSELDELCAAVDVAMKVLEARRTALITAAVSGQIDVRGIAAEDAA